MMISNEKVKCMLRIILLRIKQSKWFICNNDDCLDKTMQLLLINLSLFTSKRQIHNRKIKNPIGTKMPTFIFIC